MKADYPMNNQYPNVEGRSDASLRGTHRLLFGRRVHRSTLLIVLMFVLGAGWIVWESRTIGPNVANADGANEDPTITMTLDQMRMEGAIGKSRDVRKEKLFGPLLKDARRRSIVLLKLPRDPFGAKAKTEAPAETLATQPIPPVVEELPPSVEGLDLQSILIGAVPTAIVNGILVQEGQVIAGWKVVEIQPQKVVLQWKTHQHVVTMP